MKNNLKELSFSFLVAFTVVSAIGLLVTFVKGIINPTIKPTSNHEYSLTSVMITKFNGKSGGTGVILSSKKGESKVLTNAHVCELLSSGGFVTTDKTKGVVKYFQISEMHDLCLITTNNNFHVNTKLSDEEPEVYDEAIVSGHPHLLPNIITRGHFSQKEFINVLVGFKPCTELDAMNENTAEYCLQIGNIPIIRQFEAQVISATIMPGSSGSAVFNTKGEIAGLVFAGSGDFGYGFIVPYEYIDSFVNLEVFSISPKFPKKFFTVDKNNNIAEIKKSCSKATGKKVLQVCDLLSKTLLSIQ
jgi:S1-C subfamily serine protease